MMEFVSIIWQNLSEKVLISPAEVEQNLWDLCYPELLATGLGDPDKKLETLLHTCSAYGITSRRSKG